VVRERSNNIDTYLVAGEFMYDLVSSALLNHEGQSLRGLVDHDKLSVYVEEEMPKEAQMVTILHEAIHIWLHQAGHDIPEAAITAIAYGIYGFIRTNPFLVNKIKEGYRGGIPG
jgi:Zn-dependent peptidase ImmA (M78 family)